MSSVSVVMFALACLAPAAAQLAGGDDPYLAFAPHSAKTKYELDHQPWTDFLLTAVYVTGQSDRVPARRDDNSRQSGVRATTGSKSRYRNEGNRVLFHLFDDGAEDYVATYRQALQDTIERVDYGDLSRDEQLAFWLNLHNAVLIDEIARAHPISKPRRLRIRDQKTNLFDAKLVEVKGVPLSLNDIRYKIVYRYWSDPDVIYGFWEGAIGGPNIQPEAYSGHELSFQLGRNAREFVNSLRGVDRIRGEMRVSQVYENARPWFFRNWPQDLHDHLAEHASGEAAEIVATRPQTVRPNRYASSTADIESGETVRYAGNDNAAIVAAGESLDGIWSKLSSVGMRGGLSGEALAFAGRSELRKGRRRGTVVILDVQTSDPDITPAPDVTPQDSDGPEAADASN